MPLSLVNIIYVLLLRTYSTVPLLKKTLNQDASASVPLTPILSYPKSIAIPVAESHDGTAYIAPNITPTVSFNILEKKKISTLI